jgi:hypothetical protein
MAVKTGPVAAGGIDTECELNRLRDAGSKGRSGDEGYRGHFRWRFGATEVRCSVSEACIVDQERWLRAVTSRRAGPIGSWCQDSGRSKGRSPAREKMHAVVQPNHDPLVDCQRASRWGMSSDSMD